MKHLCHESVYMVALGIGYVIYIMPRALRLVILYSFLKNRKGASWGFGFFYFFLFLVKSGEDDALDFLSIERLVGSPC